MRDGFVRECGSVWLRRGILEGGVQGGSFRGRKDGSFIWWRGGSVTGKGGSVVE